jgi:serine phosphatase RsbU (regulator of sigma subunit)
VVRESAGPPAVDIVTAVREVVMVFCGQAPQFDDITILVLKVL